MIDNWPEGDFRGKKCVTRDRVGETGCHLVQRIELGMGCSSYLDSEETTACAVLSLLRKAPTEELKHVPMRRVIMLLSSCLSTNCTEIRL